MAICQKHTFMQVCESNKVIPSVFFSYRTWGNAKLLCTFRVCRFGKKLEFEWRQVEKVSITPVKICHKILD